MSIQLIFHFSVLSDLWASRPLIFLLGEFAINRQTCYGNFSTYFGKIYFLSCLLIGYIITHIGLDLIFGVKIPFPILPCRWVWGLRPWLKKLDSKREYWFPDVKQMIKCPIEGKNGKKVSTQLPNGVSTDPAMKCLRTGKARQGRVD